MLPSHSLTHSLTYQLTHALTHALTHQLTHLLAHLLTLLLAHLLAHLPHLVAQQRLEPERVARARREDRRAEHQLGGERRLYDMCTCTYLRCNLQPGCGGAGA